MKSGVLDGIAVDLPDVKVFLHLLYAGGGDTVCGAVDPFGRRRRYCRGLFLAQRCPKGPLDQRNDSAGRLGRAAVVFASQHGWLEHDVPELPGSREGWAPPPGRLFCVPGLPKATDVAGDVAGDTKIWFGRVG